MSGFDCATCGACCREAYHCVEVHPRDRFARAHPERLASEGKRLVLPRPDGDCVCLVREGKRFTCTTYATRPRTCRDFEVGGEHCLEARSRLGIAAPA